MNTIEIALVPISEIETDENIQYIPLEKVEYFAYIATTLTPLDAFIKVDGYTNALWEYMQEKKYQDKELFSFYDKLIHANMGHPILSSLIELYLLEKEMRNEGISDEYLYQYQNIMQFIITSALKRGIAKSTLPPLPSSCSRTTTSL